MAGPLLQRGRPACPSAGIWATCSSTSESFRIAITSPHPINTFPVFGSLSEHKTTRLQKYLFGFRGSAVTPSERRGHVCVACNGLCSRLMGGEMSISKLYTIARDGDPYRSSPRWDRAVLQHDTEKGGLLQSFLPAEVQQQTTEELRLGQLCSVLRVLNRSSVSEQAISFFSSYSDLPIGLPNPYLNVPKHFSFRVQTNK